MHKQRSSLSAGARSDPHSAAVIAGAGRGLRIGLVVSSYHDEVTSSMCQAAQGAFIRVGGRRDDLEIVEVPGAFELIAATGAFAKREDIDAVVALGCIITGETTHDQYIAHAVANGIAQVIVSTGVPIAFGVLTCQTLEQAAERAGGSKGNKGEEAMLAAIASVRAVEAIAAGQGARL